MWVVLGVFLFALGLIMFFGSFGFAETMIPFVLGIFLIAIGALLVMSANDTDRVDRWSVCTVIDKTQVKSQRIVTEECGELTLKRTLSDPAYDSKLKEMWTNLPSEGPVRLHLKGYADAKHGDYLNIVEVQKVDE